VTVTQNHNYAFPPDTVYVSPIVEPICFAANLSSIDLEAAPDRNSNIDDLGYDRYSVVVWHKSISTVGREVKLPQTIARGQTLVATATYTLDKVYRHSADHVSFCPATALLDYDGAKVTAICMGAEVNKKKSGRLEVHE
jgi:hypothetical protein